MTQQDLARLLNSFKCLNHDMEPPEGNRIIVTTVPVEELKVSSNLQLSEKMKRERKQMVFTSLGHWTSPAIVKSLRRLCCGQVRAHIFALWKSQESQNTRLRCSYREIGWMLTSILISPFTIVSPTQQLINLFMWFTQKLYKFSRYQQQI